MRPTQKASAPSAAAVTVMAATAVSAMANAVIVQSAIAMLTDPHHKWQRKHLHKRLTVVKAILQLPTAAPPKVLLSPQPRLWQTLPCPPCHHLHQPLHKPAQHL